jgi:4'-phosphopantetheinyl transferase
MAILWQTPPPKLTLTSQEIHLWRTNLDLPLAQVEELDNTLSEDEKSRAERFYFEQHRQRFIVARGMLRKILSYYLVIEPSQLEFAYSPRGKPYLAYPEALQFNLSHSQELALYGLTRDRLIGVDLEYLRTVTDVQQIAQRFFSSQEAAIISSLTDGDKEIAFLRGWTAKEAYLKATGDGLAGSLAEIEVSLTPGEPLRLLRIGTDDQTASQWTLYHLIPAPNYLATMAVEGNKLPVHYWET